MITPSRTGTTKTAPTTATALRFMLVAARRRACYIPSLRSPPCTSFPTIGLSRGTVNLVQAARFSPSKSNTLARSAGARHRIPFAAGLRSQHAVVNQPKQMATHPEEILDDSVHLCQPTSSAASKTPSPSRTVVAVRLVRHRPTLPVVTSTQQCHGTSRRQRVLTMLLCCAVITTRPPVLFGG